MVLKTLRLHGSALAIVFLSGCAGGPEAPPTVPSAVVPVVPMATVAPAPPPPVLTAPPATAAPPLPPRPPLAELEHTNIGNWLAAFNAHDVDKLALLYVVGAVQTGPFADSPSREG